MHLLVLFKNFRLSFEKNRYQVIHKLWISSIQLIRNLFAWNPLIRLRALAYKLVNIVPIKDLPIPVSMAMIAWPRSMALMSYVMPRRAWPCLMAMSPRGRRNCMPRSYRWSWLWPNWVSMRASSTTIWTLVSPRSVMAPCTPSSSRSQPRASSHLSFTTLQSFRICF